MSWGDYGDTVVDCCWYLQRVCFIAFFIGHLDLWTWILAGIFLGFSCGYRFSSHTWLGQLIMQVCNSYLQYKPGRVNCFLFLTVFFCRWDLSSVSNLGIGILPVGSFHDIFEPFNPPLYMVCMRLQMAREPGSLSCDHSLLVVFHLDGCKKQLLQRNFVSGNWRPLPERSKALLCSRRKRLPAGDWDWWSKVLRECKMFASWSNMELSGGGYHRSMLQVALDSGNVVGSNGARNWCVILLKNTIQLASNVCI